MQKRSLGKGLDSLLPSRPVLDQDAARDKNKNIMELDLAKVRPNPDQPRKDFDDKSLSELADSIREKGVIQPILVNDAGDGTWIIIAGERRYRASLKAGQKTIPAILKSFDEEETLEIALIENLQRDNLNSMEEALAFHELMTRFQLTQEEVARKLGKSRSAIANGLRLLRLPSDVQTLLRTNELSAGHARAILSVEGSDELLNEFAKELAGKGLSVRESESIAKELKSGKSLSAAVSAMEFKTDEIPGTVETGISGIDAIREMTSGATVVGSGSNVNESSTTRPAELVQMEARIMDVMGTKVYIKGGMDNGKLEVYYYSMDDLERIFDLLTKVKG